MRLARDYEMVTEAGPSTMQIRVGLSKVGEEAMQRDALSITTARPNLIPQFKKVAKQPADFVGTVTVEAEFSDAQTQEVFWAGIERRSVETTGEADYGWSDVEAELKFLAERLGYRLCVDRGDDRCPQPVRGR